MADALSCLDKIENLNNENRNNKVEPSLESLSENFALNKEDVLHHTSFKSIMGFQHKNKSLIEIPKEKPNNYSIKQFYRVDKTYSLLCRHRKIIIPKQIQQSIMPSRRN